MSLFYYYRIQNTNGEAATLQTPASKVAFAVANIALVFIILGLMPLTLLGIFTVFSDRTLFSDRKTGHWMAVFALLVIGNLFYIFNKTIRSLLYRDKKLLASTTSILIAMVIWSVITLLVAGMKAGNT